MFIMRILYEESLVVYLKKLPGVNMMLLLTRS